MRLLLYALPNDENTLLGSRLKPLRSLDVSRRRRAAHCQRITFQRVDTWQHDLPVSVLGRQVDGLGVLGRIDRDNRLLLPCFSPLRRRVDPLVSLDRELELLHGFVPDFPP